MLAALRTRMRARSIELEVLLAHLLDLLRGRAALARAGRRAEVGHRLAAAALGVAQLELACEDVDQQRQSRWWRAR